MHLTDFQFWLKDNSLPRLFDLSLSQAKALFTNSFAKEWNSASLSRKFYDNAWNDEELKSLCYSWPGLNDLEGKRPETQAKMTFVVKKEEKIEQSEKRKWKKEQRDLLDELVPKKEGKAREIEKRRLKGAYCKMEKDVDVELNDKELIGGASFQQELQKHRAREEGKKEMKQTISKGKMLEIEEKKKAYMEKEQKIMGMFREMVDQNKQ